MACDPFQMPLIHQACRREFGAMPKLITDVPPEDRRRATVVTLHIGNMVSLLHHHHAAEDAVLWPALRARISDGTAVADDAEAQHEGIAECFNDVERLRRAWSASPGADNANPLVAAIEKLSRRAETHFADEESTIVPLIREHVTAQEWQAFIDRGAAYVRPSTLKFALAFAGMMVQNATSDEQRRLAASVPIGPRLALKAFGMQAYRSYCAKVYGPNAPVSGEG